MRRVSLAARFLAVVVVAGLITNCGDSPTDPTKIGGPSLATASNGSGLSITTDKDDYAPGDTVWFTGAGWTPGDSLDIVLTDSVDVHNWTVGIDENGEFRDSTYVVDTQDLGVTFTLTATSRANPEQTLTVVFTDALSNAALFLRIPGTPCATAKTGNPILVELGEQVCAFTTISVAPATSTVSFSIRWYKGTTQKSATDFLNKGDNTSWQDLYTPGSSASDVGDDWKVQVCTNTTTASATSCGTAKATVTFAVGAPDLEIDKSHTGNFTAGQNGAYSLAVKNAGNIPTNGAITVIDTLPASMTYVSASGTHWTCPTAPASTTATIPARDIVSCTFAPGQAIAVNATSTITLNVSVAAGTCPSLTNTARVRDGNEPAAKVDAKNRDDDVTTIAGCNQKPIADAGTYTDKDEGEEITLDGSGSSDPDGDALTYQWRIVSFTPPVVNNGGTCSFKNGGNTGVSPIVICNDNGTLIVGLTVNDGNLDSDEDQATITVKNVAPSVSTPITAPLDYSVWAITATQFGSNGFVTAPFSDAGKNDTHTCTIDWGDGDGPVPGTVTETAGSGSGSCTSIASWPAGSSPYTDDGAGIYIITVKVTDDDTGEGTASVTIVVYDPSAGFVTGGGWINSLAGYCKLADCLSAEGKANFGFVSKYLKGATVPTGNTEFQFQAGNLNFHSETYQWLIVNQNGTNAQYKGSGTINGVGGYNFMLWAQDGGKNTFDTFRIQITDANKNLVYDNGSGDGASPVPIGGGSINIQTGKK